MKAVLRFFVNTIYFILVITIALGISTIALTRKVNQSQTNLNSLSGTVVKEKVVVLTLTRGIVNVIQVKNGQPVRKGDVLVKMSNPVLENNFKVYQERTDNESAQTEANIAKVSLDNLTIKSPVDGVVGELYTAEGSSVDEFSKVMLIYSSKDMRLQADLTGPQYQKIQKLSKVNAYSARLNQDFTIVPGLIRADEKATNGTNEKKIGLYFSFANENQAAALVHNEDLTLNLEETTRTRKPIDIFIDFWNGLLSRKV